MLLLITVPQVGDQLTVVTKFHVHDPVVLSNEATEVKASQVHLVHILTLLLLLLLLLFLLLLLILLILLLLLLLRYSSPEKTPSPCKE